MKFFTDNGEITTVKADQALARRCYNARLEIQKAKKEGSQDSPHPPSSLKVMMVDLDARQREGRRLELDGRLEEVQIEKEPSQTTCINKTFPTSLKQDLVGLLKSNADLFAWAAADILEINPEFMCHQVSVFLGAQLVAQKRRRMSPNRTLVVQEQVQILLDAGFIYKII